MSDALVTPSRWSWRGLLRALAIAALAFGTGAGLGYLVGHEKVPEGPHVAQPPPSPAPLPPPAPSPLPPVVASSRPAATDVELALLAPLREGGTFEGFAVTEIDPVGDDGSLQLVCKKGDASVRLEVYLSAPGGPTPPATSGPYSVFYALRGASDEAGARLATALAAVLGKNAAVPAPARLKAFKER